MRRADFAASLRFAALAALAWPAVACVLAPLVGARGALALHAAACAGLYAARFGRARLARLRSRPARALLYEALLAAAGAALARAVFSPTLAGTALAIWAFGLVQSGGCLLHAPGPAAPAGDPFELATRRARALLEEEP
jgi:hypothetical protein